MDNSNFEQQFKQNVKATATPLAAAPIADNSSNKLPLIIAIVLAIVTLVESIVLIITLKNYFSLANGDGYEYLGEDFDPGFVNEGIYTYDEDYNLTAFSLSCTAEDGSSYSFTTDNQYSQVSNDGSTISNGPYTIANSSLISLTDNNKVLYYDGLDIADGLTVYTCKEVPTEADTDDTSTE